MHRMFRAETAKGVYAVKCLNPEIMKRPGVMENYRRAEKLEQVLENAGIPLAPALALDGQKMQELDGEYFYVFRWQEGRITDWQHITAELFVTIHFLLLGRHSYVALVDKESTLLFEFLSTVFLLPQA